MVFSVYEDLYKLTFFGGAGHQSECERGLAAMEVCHVKATEELQQRHLKEVDSLLAERDRMLNEEAVATATGELYFKNISPTPTGQ